MKAATLSIAILLTAAVLVVPIPTMAQDLDGSSRRVEPVKPLHDGKGGRDFATSRANADAKAHQGTDVDVKNKLNQKQSAIGVGIGGSSSVDVKNKNANLNVNTLKTGDIINLNANSNKQTQSFGAPLVRDLRPR